MAALVWIGAGLAALGLAGVLGSALLVLRARREGEAALRARMARALPLNLGGLLLAMLGLGVALVGLILA